MLFGLVFSGNSDKYKQTVCKSNSNVYFRNFPFCISPNLSLFLLSTVVEEVVPEVPAGLDTDDIGVEAKKVGHGERENVVAVGTGIGTGIGD